MIKIFKIKHNGSSSFWLNGMVLLFISMSMIFLIFTHQIINKINYSIEDAMTYSVLGAATIDKERLAVTGDVYVDDYQKCFNTFCSLFSKNTGCDLFIGGEAGGSDEHRFFDFSDNKKIKIKKFIIYDVPTDSSFDERFKNPDPIDGLRHMRGEIHSYIDGNWSITEYTEIPGSGVLYYTIDSAQNAHYFVKTPDIPTKSGSKQNVEITQTSIFVEMEIPLKVKFFNIRGTTTKCQIINIVNK